MVDLERSHRPAATTLPAADPVSDEETERLLTEFVATRDPQLRDALAQRFDRVVQWLSRKFARGTVPIEDLVQMGRIGLLQALDRYDPERGVKFLTYAISMITGEIKHYFRDCAWGLRVPRQLQELAVALPRVEEGLYTKLGRSPTLTEMAESLGVTEEQIAAAMELGSAFQPQSLNVCHPFGDWESHEELQDLLGSADRRLEAVVEFEPLYSAMKGLDERKHWIVRRRYFEDWSQTEVARELGISQMHVSRLEREALNQLRVALQQNASP
jgi:RNA polymerase sigma-B factor